MKNNILDCTKYSKEEMVKLSGLIWKTKACGDTFYFPVKIVDVVEVDDKVVYHVVKFQFGKEKKAKMTSEQINKLVRKVDWDYEGIFSEKYNNGTKLLVK